jgi:hypothetical protein
MVERGFYLAPAMEVVASFLGKVLVHQTDQVSFPPLPGHLT